MAKKAETPQEVTVVTQEDAALVALAAAEQAATIATQELAALETLAAEQAAQEQAAQLAAEVAARVAAEQAEYDLLHNMIDCKYCGGLSNTNEAHFTDNGDAFCNPEHAALYEQTMRTINNAY